MRGESGGSNEERNKRRHDGLMSTLYDYAHHRLHSKEFSIHAWMGYTGRNGIMEAPRPRERTCEQQIGGSRLEAPGKSTDS